MSQIIALGGAGFSDEPAHTAINQYILKQTNTARPNVCFVPTATGDSLEYTVNFYAAFSKLKCNPSHLSLFTRTPDLRELLLKQQIIYVGGGNTRSMLAVWRNWGMDHILQEALEAGILLCGPSAGAICWFEQGLTDSSAGHLAVLDCLGFLSGSCTPHYHSEADRKPSLHAFMKSGAISAGYALDDYAGVHFQDGKLLHTIASQAGAQAYYVSVAGGKMKEEALDMDFIG